MYKLLSIVLSLLFLFDINFAYGQTPLYISAEAGILIEYETGTILFEKNAHKRMYPASTTKVVTALLVLENAKLDDIVKIDYDLGYIDGSSMYLKKGESFTVRQLLECLLIKSANDAAVALANHVSGSVEEFAHLMNKRALELGCKNSHFTNPNGLPDPKHYSSAYDLALFAKEAMKYEVFREIVKTPYLRIPPTPQTPNERVFRNSNRFLWGEGGRHTIDYKGKTVNIKYDVIDGIKTGYTNVARQCLISSGQINNTRVISVVLKAEGKNIYIDSRKLIDYGLENYKLENIFSKEQIIGNKLIPLSKENTIKYGPSDDCKVLLRKDENLSKIHTNIVLDPNLSAPIKYNDIIGKIQIYKDNSLIYETNLIALSDATPILVKYYNLNTSTHLSIITKLILFSLIVFICIKRIK
ncbi:D-alanyl-D-alanine carboxypeptidase (penicillin-binding protein 5/6) [Alkalithermobacter thermoalcaliphilus JW-YL-7 = DSM 7308]|uniref:serine-type D-Ala-D-Ala carboxypeptidase n=1 Tax=Alkalithermobacter thermoalcaliphilus JW-YL-7 = DSM 7308 TaxID=1121328 RepID=A0A150FR66_CLOPD|nr:Serine-type D-Ala-D-Ala carboxypeptidase [[Clostridium] paradoxum JW-YL-7 = DSM 7308]SHL02402.1 D-alanyl-D-alanine carboxypeptidase (penicillin-binding protein 5/6) [[Clostridium] paradoxum JW-YL-7 = DSM 7308]